MPAVEAVLLIAVLAVLAPWWLVLVLLELRKKPYPFKAYRPGFLDSAPARAAERLIDQLVYLLGWAALIIIGVILAGMLIAVVRWLR